MGTCSTKCEESYKEVTAREPTSIMDCRDLKRVSSLSTILVTDLQACSQLNKRPGEVIPHKVLSAAIEMAVQYASVMSRGSSHLTEASCEIKAS